MQIIYLNNLSEKIKNKLKNLCGKINFNFLTFFIKKKFLGGSGELFLQNIKENRRRYTHTNKYET